MKVVGLCGGSGSGKGTVSRILSSRGVPIIDTDAIYHRLTSSPGECLDALRSEFGEQIIKGSTLDRPKLAHLVFSSVDSEYKRSRLNSITHGFVLEEVRREIKALEIRGDEFCVVDIPLLFESGFDKECDLTVAVIAERHERISRIILRDGISAEAAEARINAQLSDEKLKRMTDMFLNNSDDISNLENQVSELIDKIKKCEVNKNV